MFKRGVGRRHADRTLRGYAAFGIGPVEIGFRAQDQRAGLPIEPGLAAADRAEYRCVRSRESYAASAERALVARQADAEIAAYVETAPVGDGGKSAACKPRGVSVTIAIDAATSQRTERPSQSSPKKIKSTERANG